MSVVQEPGARVASWMGKTRLACLMPLACARAGFVHVPVNPLLKYAQAAYILTDSGAVLLVGTKARLETLESGNVPASWHLVAEGGGGGARDATNVGLPLHILETANLVLTLT